MREILYRGKRIDNGEWVIGYYCPCVFGNFPAEPAIIDADELKNGKWAPVKVTPETVCQYTGLKDKNGKRIFVFDIVEGKPFKIVEGEPFKMEQIEHGKYLITFSNGSFRAEWNIGRNNYNTDFYCLLDRKVVGNWWDNRELFNEN